MEHNPSKFIIIIALVQEKSSAEYALHFRSLKCRFAGILSDTGESLERKSY